MKRIILLLFFCVFSLSVAQNTNTTFDKFLQEINKNNVTDTNDKTVLELLDRVYKEGLQSDAGKLSPETKIAIQNYYNSEHPKNLGILNLFFAYTQHIQRAAASGKAPNVQFQLLVVNALREQLSKTYQVIPAIVWIYAAEALETGGHKAEGAKVVHEGLGKYPDSIPLQVYEYLNTKDPKLKESLLKNHPTHWMVKRFEIEKT